MSMKEMVVSALQELIVPELDKIKQEGRQIQTTLDLTNKRLDDLNLHLAEQSRRIDETNKRIDQTNNRIDETNNRIDETNKRIDETNNRIDLLRKELVLRIDAVRGDMTQRIDGINSRMDRFCEVIVRRDEHAALEKRLADLEQEVVQIKQRLAA